MIAVGNNLVSDDLVEEQFVCDLKACKGACCVEGDNGAPLEQEELAILEESYADYKDFLTEEGRQAIESSGFFYFNPKEGTFNTALIDGKACAYVNYENGVAVCGIEKAQEAGKLKFKKPISCHLYPVRITKYEDYDAVNYERWDICDAACTLGKSLKVPVYQFVKAALIRKYGEEFYEELDAVAGYLKSKKD